MSEYSVIPKLLAGGMHFTQTIVLSPDAALSVSEDRADCIDRIAYGK